MSTMEKKSERERKERKKSETKRNNKGREGVELGQEN